MSRRAREKQLDSMLHEIYPRKNECVRVVFVIVWLSILIISIIWRLMHFFTGFQQQLHVYYIASVIV